MTEFKIPEPLKATEWTIYRHKTFSVVVRHWMSGERNNWNVYAHIFDNSPLFGNVDALMGFHFHGGVTYDQLVTHVPAQGIKYDWQKENKAYKIGSDYNHYKDDYEGTGAEYGIPPNVRYDAEKLAKELYEASEEMLEQPQL